MEIQNNNSAFGTKGGNNICRNRRFDKSLWKVTGEKAKTDCSYTYTYTRTRTHAHTRTRTRIYNTRLFNIFLKLRIFLWLQPQFFLGRRGTFLEAKLSYKTFIIKPNFGIVRHQFWQYLNSFWQSIICRWIILTMKKITTISPILWNFQSNKNTAFV